MDRNLDGFFYRYQDEDGNWVNKCFTDLPENEQDKFLDSLSTPGLIKMCKEFAGIIRAMAEQFNIVRAESQDEN